MAKSKLASKLKLTGIAPNLLLQQVESTAPFLFKGELDTSGPERAYLEKLRFYKKNLKALKHINLAEYFHICMASHWSTAGTFVPTNVDNQIREGLWKHQEIRRHIEQMASITIASYRWDYRQVTNRKSYNPSNGQVISTHEGTWLSVAIGAYCALTKYKMTELADEVANLIWEEIVKERELLLHLKENGEHISFIKAAPLVAHNLGDLDRVMVQWNMHDSDPFCKKVYKMGHILNDLEFSIFIYSGAVNKAMTSKENHRHMSMRQPRCLRKSYQFLIPVGPFMDEWGGRLGESGLLTVAEKAEIVAAFYDGYSRQDQAFGYCRAYGALVNTIPGGSRLLDNELPFDLVAEIRKSKFLEVASLSKEEFEQGYIDKLADFICPTSNIKF